MLKLPSRRRNKLKMEKPNLVPIMDATFIFIFFLLVSASFTNMLEITSDVPIISEQQPPPDDKPPLALTLRITDEAIEILTGVPSRLNKRVGKLPDGTYDLIDLYNTIVGIKQQNPDEKTAILQPEVDLEYDMLIKIMDHVRLLQNTDTAIFTKDKNGIDVRVNELFSNLIFGNIQS